MPGNEVHPMKQIVDDLDKLDRELEQACGIFTANDGRRIIQFIKRVAEALVPSDG